MDDKKRGAIVVIMQRLHEEDLTSHHPAKQGWEHLSLPAVAERHEVWKFPVTKHVIERQPCDLLWEARFPQTVLDEMKKDLL